MSTADLRRTLKDGDNKAMNELGRATLGRQVWSSRQLLEVMVDQFTKPHYRETFTGWDNHRWVRFRALLSVLPDWLGSYASGRAVLGVDPTAPPSYDLSARGSDLAAKLVEGLDQLATTVRTADPKAVADLEEQPRPLGAIRRIPQI